MMIANNIKRGAFIVFEGCDKCGKTTQSMKLVEKLQKLGIMAQQIQFPDRSTATGKIISDYLTKKQDLPDQAIHLLFSANRWESEPKIRQLLQQGVTLVCDRYSSSGVAYSSAKASLDMEWCLMPEVGLPKPDLVFFLMLESVSGVERQGYGDERYENDDFQQLVYQNYLKMKDDTWMLINADRGVEEIHEEIVQHAREAIQRAENSELKTLW